MRHDTQEFKKNKRILIWGKYPEKAKCLECFYEQKYTFDIEIHHKDGNHKNNKIENLIPLCRLCHMKKHYPSIKRLIPSGCGGLRKNRRILDMVRKEVLDQDDYNFLKTLSCGNIFISAWFKPSCFNNEETE